MSNLRANIEIIKIINDLEKSLGGSTPAM